MTEWKTQVEQPVPTHDELHTLEESVRFSPRNRPVYPRLIVMDEGLESGEIVRLRSHCLTIGRTQCDLSFPAEGLMSGTHARISFQIVAANQWAWILEDQSSRNGVFVKQSPIALVPGTEILIGGTRVLVHGDLAAVNQAATETPSLTPHFAKQSEIGKKWELELLPYLFFHEPIRIALQGRSLQLGRHAAGAEFLATDPFVEPIHAIAHKTGTATWNLLDQQSLNGCWLRVQRATLSHDMLILIGEQQFRFEIPSHF